MARDSLNFANLASISSSVSASESDLDFSIISNLSAILLIDPSRFNSLSKRIKRFDSIDSDGNDSNHWMGKRIISLNDWIRLRGTPYTLQYFPDNFDRSQTYLTESELKDCDDLTKKWYIDYEELMECKRNPNYGRTKCFQCLLNPVRDDPIFIGINKLVAKGLEEDQYENKNNPKPYPCPVANRFECPYERGKSSSAKFDVEDLFELANIPFAVEISLAIARKDTSSVQTKNIATAWQRQQV